MKKINKVLLTARAEDKYDVVSSKEDYLYSNEKFYNKFTKDLDKCLLNKKDIKWNRIYITEPEYYEGDNEIHSKIKTFVTGTIGSIILDEYNNILDIRLLELLDEENPDKPEKMINLLDKMKAQQVIDNYIPSEYDLEGNPTKYYSMRFIRRIESSIYKESRYEWFELTRKQVGLTNIICQYLYNYISIENIKHNQDYKTLLQPYIQKIPSKHENFNLPILLYNYDNPVKSLSINESNPSYNTEVNISGTVETIGNIEVEKHLVKKITLIDPPEGSFFKYHNKIKEMMKPSTSIIEDESQEIEDSFKIERTEVEKIMNKKYKDCYIEYYNQTS